MKKERIYELWANMAIVVMLTVVLVASFSGGFYGVRTERETYAPIYKGNSDKNKICLMINVYWGTEYVLPMAEIFNEYGFKTTFFIGGSWAAQNPGIVRQLADMGFELGNHGYNHKNHKNLNEEQNKTEILVTENLLREITDTEPAKLFAPPSGDMGDVMHSVCEQYGYKVIMWTRDTVDWRDKNSSITFSRAVKNRAAGDLILMHPTAHTLEALPKILKYVRASGLEAAKVGEVI